MVEHFELHPRDDEEGAESPTANPLFSGGGASAFRPTSPVRPRPPERGEFDYPLPACLKRLQKADTLPPPKTALAAIFLLTLGIILSVLGLAEGWYHSKGGHEFPLFVTGGVCVVPGAYASWCLWGAFRRWPGYRYDQVPSWDD
ncbi:hypothetical protein M885DRAFT_620754 [Pelagophyceae sp. CCMP2097]|nr:hypothetical protein M885DRAFT_620754 [Pelagophyceae sp. CCMP2097]